MKQPSLLDSHVPGSSRIGLLGSHGTGKTSLAAAYSAATGVPLVTSASRRVKQAGWPINQHATCESQAATTVGRLAAQLSAGDRFVSDRTLLDSMAYNKWQLDHIWKSSAKTTYWYETMEQVTLHAMQLYDALFYIPISFPIVADGVRATEIVYQRQIDELIQQFIVQYGLAVHVVPAGEIPARLQFMLQLA